MTSLPDSILERVQSGDLGHELHRGVKLDDVLALSERNDVLCSTDGRYAVIQDGPGRSSLEASWHIDGLSRDVPPSTLILYCENAGRGDITTDLAEVVPALDALDSTHLSILNEVNSYYLSRNGEESYCKPLIQLHPNTGSVLLNLCSRGWIRGSIDATLEQVTMSMAELYRNLVPIVSHRWSHGDCLVINNIKYVHRRRNIQNTIDPNRRLIRMAFA